MRAKWRLIVLSILISSITCLLQGCGNPSGTVAGSCSLTASGLTSCYDYTGSGFTTSSAQTTCSGTSGGGTTGTYSSSACSTSGLVGSCKVSSGATEYYVRYLSGYTSTTAQAACTLLSGTYTSA